MNIKTWIAAVTAGLAGLAGCDEQRAGRLEEGVSGEAEVRRQFGEPATVTAEADGSRVLEYPRQPAGWTNYLVTIGPDGKMSSLRQLLTPDNFARVQPGQGKMEVRRLLGRPAKTMVFELKGEEVWDWRFHPDPNSSKLFSVVFDRDGRVLRSAVGDDPQELHGGPGR